jgi:hypothetical protein
MAPSVDTEFAQYPAKQARGRRASDRRLNWAAVGVVTSAVAIILTALLSLASRVAALETQARNDAARMERVENKLDRLLERVK